MSHILASYTQIATSYLLKHRKAIGVSAACLVSAGILIALFIFNNPSKIVYQPVNACTLLTPAKAQDLLGDKVISIDTKGAAISGDIAVSKCSYTDSNPVAEQMIVAAIAVRSGVNDKGTAQNKTDFATAAAQPYNQPVQHIGDAAFFNPRLGQLNVLRGRSWILLSYGLGSAPQANTIDKTIELAHEVLH